MVVATSSEFRLANLTFGQRLRWQAPSRLHWLTLQHSPFSLVCVLQLGAPRFKFSVWLWENDTFRIFAMEICHKLEAQIRNLRGFPLWSCPGYPTSHSQVMSGIWENPRGWWRWENFSEPIMVMLKTMVSCRFSHWNQSETDRGFIAALLRHGSTWGHWSNVAFFSKSLSADFFLFGFTWFYSPIYLGWIIWIGIITMMGNPMNTYEPGHLHNRNTPYLSIWAPEDYLLPLKLMWSQRCRGGPTAAW